MFKLQSDGKQMTVVNTDKGSSIALNRGNHKVHAALIDAGYAFDVVVDDRKYINLSKPFNIDIDEDLAKKLARTTMDIKTPARVKREKPAKVKTEEVDEYIPSLMDILLQD